MQKFTGRADKSRRLSFKLRPRLLVFATTLPLLLFSQQAMGDESERDAAPNSASTLSSETTEARKDRLQRSILDAAQQAERKHDSANALSYYRSLYERHPNNIDVVVGMSRNLRRLGRSTEAEALVERALKTIDRNHMLLAEAGKVRLSLGKAMPAIDSLSRAESLGAKAWDIYTALAVAYDRVGMFDQAEARYRKALELSPDNAVVLNNFALSRAQAGDLDQAIENLSRASALPEATPRMRQNLALFFAIKGDLKAAEDLVRRDLPPKDAAANMAYYRQLRAQVEAQGNQTKLLGMTPKIVTTSTSRTASDATDKIAGKEKTDTGTLPAPAKSQTRVPMAKVEAIKVEAAKPLASPTKVEVAKPLASPAPGNGDGNAKKLSEKSTVMKADSGKVADGAAAQAEVQSAKLPTPLVSAGSASKKEQSQSEQPKPATQKYDYKAVKAAKQFGDGLTAKSETLPTDGAKPKQSASLKGDGATYRLQLGAFRDAGRADALVSKLMKSHETLLAALKLEVEEITVANQGIFYRVVSQVFNNRDLGKQSCESLKKEGYSCLMARRN